MRPGVGAVDLVDHHDRLQPALERLAEHEPRLRHGAFGGVDQHQGAVGHPQHALHLAAEIGVAGRVDDVDLHALVGDGDVLGQDRDAPLALQLVGVEDALADQLAFAELAALAQQAIDQRRLAVVDVGDDGHIADVVASHEFGPIERPEAGTEKVGNAGVLKPLIIGVPGEKLQGKHWRTCKQRPSEPRATTLLSTMVRGKLPRRAAVRMPNATQSPAGQGQGLLNTADDSIFLIPPKLRNSFLEYRAKSSQSAKFNGR